MSQQMKGSAGSRLGLLVVALLISAAVAFGAVELMRPNAQPNTSILAAKGPVPAPTVTRPLSDGSGTQVSLAQATQTFGSTIALPSTSAVQPSDLGPIWMSDVPGGTTVAVTFPAKGIWISYNRAAPGDPASQVDPATHYKDEASTLTGTDLMQLNGTTPAIYIPANDGTGTNAVDFEANGAEIDVCGNNDEATLEAIAQSILTQLTPSSSS